MSLNQSMNISLNSMKNNQYALAVVSHNIANLNTDGYHRQRVNFSENRNTTNCENVITTIKGLNGASIDSLTGFIDDGAFRDVIDKNSDAQYYNSLNDILGDLEDISNELGDNGLGSLLNDFYVAASNLEKYPADLSMRQQFLMAAETVCDKFNYVSDRYAAFEGEKYDEIKMDVSVVNSLLSDLAEANRAHVLNNQSDSTKVNIDNILAELSDYVQVTTDTNTTGSVNVYLNGLAIVQGNEVKYTLDSSYDNSRDVPLQFSLVSTEDPEKIITKGVTDAFNSGSIKAYKEILNGTGGKTTSIGDMKTALDKAAAGFAKALNDIQTYDDGTVFAAYLKADETTGEPILERIDSSMKLFTTKDDSASFTAKNIRVNPDMNADPFKVAAARIDSSLYPDDSWTKSIGNSDNAAEFSKMRNAKILEYDNGIKCTLSDFLTNNAAKVGMDAGNAASKADLYQDLADSAAANYSNLIGVNLDEELADMIRYQRSFEASARVFAAVNNIMDTIMNLV